MPTLNRNQIIAAAAGTLELLEFLGCSQEPMTLRELVAASGRPKGTVHRMISTLVNTGFVTYTRQAGLYELTLKAWRIGAAALGQLDLVECARPMLYELLACTGETVHLSILENSGEIVFVAKVPSPRSVLLHTRIGQRNPSWCTATGRAILAFHETVAVEVLAGRLDHRTPNTVTDRETIGRVLARVRRIGHAVNRAENHPQTGGIAAPIRDHADRRDNTAGVAMPVDRMTDDVVKSVVPSVCRAAKAVSTAMGYGLAAARGKSKSGPVGVGAVGSAA
jgi:IclR family transcriptional regulator, KDG regulon repressor